MIKKAIFIICLLLLALLVLDYLVRPLSLHRYIKPENVTEIMLWSEASGRNLATEEEIKSIVTWFNSASGLSKNNSVPGESPQSVIIIKHMDGKEILISRILQDLIFHAGMNTGGISFIGPLKKN